ncbi:hypothetical protein FBQ97_03470 [Acidobacteria bacterium ACD]|nr:hypothetical protein [Acidobacteria bacterium ACD]
MAPEETGLDWLEALGPQRIRPGLSRTRALLAGLGDPQGSFRSVLVAGTNGKGSTAAFASSILAAAGVRAGLYTSPHLVEVTERVRVGERDVPRRELSDALALVAAVSGAGALAPTYFEALTVAAFELFRRRGVTVAVVEVGIGGRLDATNVLSPEVSAVTNVGLDHLDVLGPTLADVARENRARKEKPATRSLGVIDNESLRKAGASPVRTPTPGRGRSAPSSPGTAPAFVPTDNDGRTEEYWRGRARSTRIRVEGAENEARRLEAETRRLENDFYAWSDGNYRDQVIKPAWDKAREDLKKARAEVDAAKATEDGLAEEARKAGAPPGWVR